MTMFELHVEVEMYFSAVINVDCEIDVGLMNLLLAWRLRNERRSRASIIPGWTSFRGRSQPAINTSHKNDTHQDQVESSEQVKLLRDAVQWPLLPVGHCSDGRYVAIEGVRGTEALNITNPRGTLGVAVPFSIMEPAHVARFQLGIGRFTPKDSTAQ